MQFLTRPFFVRVFAVLALTLLFVFPARGQYSSGIQGTVVDPYGAAIPGARCTVVNQGTLVEQQAISDSRGTVRIDHLAPGLYTVKIEAAGFEKWVLKDVNVEGSDVRAIYPTLKVGGNTATVEVRSETEFLETTTGTISRALEEETLKVAPLVGQNLFASVATLAPGVTGLVGSAGSQYTNVFSSEANFQINGAGQRQDANEYQVDGLSVNVNSRDGGEDLEPEPDTVAEMKVTPSIFSAEKGRQSGTLIEVFTKPGTNQFHGSLSEMHTDAAMTARTEFQTKVPHSLRNDYGGTIGGPIVKNHTFFFGSYFGMRSLVGDTWQERVESPDFEQYVIQNYPNTIAAQFFKLAPVASAPTTNLLTVAQTTAQYWSSFTPPNIPSTMIASGDTTYSTSPYSNAYQWHARVDHNLGANDKVFVSFFDSATQVESPDIRPALSYTSPNGTITSSIDYVHTFSPTVVNEASIGFLRDHGNQPAPLPNLPNVAWIGGVDATFWQWGPSGWVQNNWYMHDTLNFTRGNHTFRVGIDVDRQQDMDNFTNGDDRPYFLMLNILDMAADHPFSQVGPTMDPKTEKVATNLYQRVLMLYTAPFIQDDWKVTRRLTLNLGLRYDYFGHLATVENGHNPIAFFTPGTGATFQQQVTNGSMVVRAGNGNATDSIRARFAPRIGFAWDVFGNGSTSVHGGYGLFNTKIGEYAYVNNMRTNPPDAMLPNISIFNYGQSAANIAYMTSNSGAQGFAPPPGITYQIDSHGGIVGNRIEVGGIDPKLKPPLVHSWALGIQRRIGGFVAEADYFGTAGRDLFLQTDVNRFAGDEIANNGSLTRLNQSFAEADYGRSIGIANSNIGSLALSRHFSKGWSVHGIFTYGKSLDLTSNNDNGVNGDRSAETIFDVSTLARQYARSDYDVRKRLSLDAVWNTPHLPWGVARTITEGWSLSPIVVLQSGEPFTVYTSAQYSQGGDYNADGWDFDVPNVPSFGRTIHGDRSQYLKGIFKASDFPVPTAGTEGNLGRNTYESPGIAYVNLSAQRTFPLHVLGDAGQFEVRGTFVNLFNRVNLSTPVSDLSNSLFGKSVGQFAPRDVEVMAHIRF